MAIISKILKKLFIPLTIAISAVILTIIALNNKLLFGPLLGVFNYTNTDLRDLKGWKGWGRIWRGWNRASFFNGILLDWFDGNDYTKEERNMDKTAYTNFGGIFRIFLTVMILLTIGKKSGISAFRIVKATVFRFVVVACLGDLIFNQFFLDQPDIDASPAMKETLEQMETTEARVVEIETQLDTLAPDKKAARKAMKAAKKELRDVKRAACSNKRQCKKDKRNKVKFKWKQGEAKRLVSSIEQQANAKQAAFDTLKSQDKALTLELTESLAKLKKLNKDYKKHYFTIMNEERKIPRWVKRLLKVGKKETDTSKQEVAPKNLTDIQARWYIDKYPDLKTTFIVDGVYDIEGAKKHWQTYGIVENKEWLKPDEKPPILDDAQARWYINKYDDLKAAFAPDDVYNLEAAKNHWVVYGYEGKSSHTEWLPRYNRPTELSKKQAKWYMERYPDLKTEHGVTDIASARAHWKSNGYDGTSHPEWIPSVDKGPPLNKKQIKLLQNLSLGLSYLLAGFLNVMVYSMINNKDKKPMRIVMMTMAFVLMLYVPVVNLNLGYTNDLVDMEGTQSVLQDWVNKYHPRSLDKDAKTVKAGFNYDTVQTLQMIVAASIGLMMLSHIFFAWWEYPKALSKCRDGPMEATPIQVSTGPAPTQDLCPEDALAIGKRGYFPQTLFMRLVKGMEQPLKYELANIFVPVAAGIMEGQSAMKEARKTGIKDPALQYDYKQKGFVYGYWRSVMIILFVTIIMKSEAFKAALQKSKTAAIGLTGRMRAASPKAAMAAMRGKMAKLR